MRDRRPWMLFITGIARVARKADSIVARIGLAPAVTGEGLGRGLPGMVALVVVRSVSADVTKTAAGGRHTKSSSSSSWTKPPQTPPVSGGAPSGMAGTRRTSNPSQGPVHHGAPPSDGTGVVPPVHPGQGTQHISGAKPPVTGAAGRAKRKGRKRHG